MVSLTKNAEKTPDTATIAINSSSGRCACSTTRSATSAKKPENSQVRHHDHHAEQQDDGVEIDGAISLVEGKRVHAQHEAGADDRRASAVDTEAGQAADGEHQVGDGEDENRGQARRAPQAPRRLYQLKITSLKKPTANAETPRKLPKGSS